MVVKVLVNTDGSVDVDRDSLYASKDYKRQVEALKRVVEKRLGYAGPSVIHTYDEYKDFVELDCNPIDFDRSKKMKKNLIIMRKIEKCNRDWPSENAFEFIEWLQNLLKDIPEESRDSASIEITSEEQYGDSVSVIILTYSRPETDKEQSQREELVASLAEATKKRELAMLETLQKKYGVEKT